MLLFSLLFFVDNLNVVQYINIEQRSNDIFVEKYYESKRKNNGGNDRTD